MIQVRMTGLLNLLNSPNNELKALSNVIRNLNSDILVLEEVENKEIVEQVLSMAGLKNRYNIIVGKSDGRGMLLLC